MAIWLPPESRPASDCGQEGYLQQEYGTWAGFAEMHRRTSWVSLGSDVDALAKGWCMKLREASREPIQKPQRPTLVLEPDAQRRAAPVAPVAPMVRRTSTSSRGLKHTSRVVERKGSGLQTRSRGFESRPGFPPTPYHKPESDQHA